MADVAVAGLSEMAGLYEGRRINSVGLNGTWEFALGDGTEEAANLDGAPLRWKAVEVPNGQFVERGEDSDHIKFVWVRRKFDLTEAQAQRLAILRWGRICFGAVAYINGERIIDYPPTGPCQIIVPSGVLRAEHNSIALKIAGTAGLPLGKSGWVMIPAGFVNEKRKGVPSIDEDIWIEFADAAYMKWALAMPDLAGSKVRIRVTLDGLEKVEGLKIAATVKSWPRQEVIGRAEVGASVAERKPAPALPSLAEEHFFVEVPMPGFKAWTHEDPNLYVADLQLMRGGKVLDSICIRFGMRAIGTAKGRYQLNGRNLYLRGSEVVGEWKWGAAFTADAENYLVTEAREMSMNSFRTHTVPPPAHWADVCDERGTMLLAEFPVLYNNGEWHFTAEEYEIYHRNCMLDAMGWMARLWNHPSVIMWVISNESLYDNYWEYEIFQNFVTGLDPTRPTMRTGSHSGTKTNLDWHECHNLDTGLEGELISKITSWVGRANGRPLTNTEYMNYFPRPVSLLTGVQDKDREAIAIAQLGMEHTEAMRRADFAGLWPYMYAGWTKASQRIRHGKDPWRGGFAAPISAVWHSALSPVLASLDLFDANYLTGQEVTTDLHLINESWHDAKVRVEVVLTKEDPQFIPEAECLDSPLDRWAWELELPSDTHTKRPITWKLPEAPGMYYLTARTSGMGGRGGRAVLSTRIVRAIKRGRLPESAKGRTIVLLGANRQAEEYLASLGLTIHRDTENLNPGSLVLIWNPGALGDAEKRALPALAEFARSGGRVVVLGAKTWDLYALARVGPGRVRASRVFAYADVDHPLLKGVEPEGLMRWNGLPGMVATADLVGEGMALAEKILWAREERTTVAAEVATPDRKGRVLFCQLELQPRVNPKSPMYDPVAEKILFNILGV